ncbi:uncharacterized protein C2845_PM01G44240 [Panicum miliaceum]|uniref:RanBP2-type domain-containing protein n=1 Tax=Panicum miliaceum TaxID=4540 RepID=A0A3L6TSW6_PANMI|nr:uncharacterized protein C2845_PM01G44240 [Panicum miliaceum]
MSPRSPPPSPGAREWPCFRCTLNNPIYSDKCEACEAPRPLELDADSPVVVAAAAALTPLPQLRRKRERSPAVADAECPVEVDVDSPVGAVAAPASTPLRRLRRKVDRAQAVVEIRVEVDADSPTVVVDASGSPIRRCGRKRERATAVAEAERPVEVDADSSTVVVDASASPPRRCGRKRERAASPDVVELCNSAGRACGGGENGEGKAPAAKKASLGIHLDKKTFKIMTYNVWFREDMELSRRMDALGDLIKHHSPDFICFQDGWIDAWVELKPGDDGWTYDTKANSMLSGNRKLQKRMDRFLCKLEDFKIDNIEMIGKEAITGISYFKEKKVRKECRKIELPVFPSDHFGLVLTITKQGGGIF